MTRLARDDSDTSFATRVAGLSEESFVDFCEALWDARGYTVQRSGARLVVERDGECNVLFVWWPPNLRSRVARWLQRVAHSTLSTDARERRRTDAPVDAVVTPVGRRDVERVAEAHGARLLGPAALSDLLLYGVDREAADELTARFFGVETPELLPRRQNEADRAAGPRPGWVATLAVGAACCLVVAAVLAGVWSPGGEVILVDDTGAPLSVGADTDSPADGALNGSREGEPPDGGASIQPTFPPGVGDGSLDVDSLAAAHVSAVNGSSYRLVVRQSGTVSIDSGERWQSAWQHAVVEDERTWLFSVVGTEQHPDGPRLVQYTDYASGDVVYRRGDTRDGPVYDRLSAPVTTHDGGDPHAERTGHYLRRYLATSDVEVDRPTWWPEAYRVVATGQPTTFEEDVSAYTATALVNESGFVSRLTVEYTWFEAGETRQARFRMEYAAVNETRVRPPGWLDEARNETAVNETSG